MREALLAVLGACAFCGGARADVPLEAPCAERMQRGMSGCCWPGQAWSQLLSACVGAPSCPAQTHADGAQCYRDCPEGQVANGETLGLCCWRGQAWSRLERRCVGVPECPAGWSARGNVCAPGCAPGMRTTIDTGGHCCWPRQVWSASKGRCLGVPRCPSDYEAWGEWCIARPSPKEPPPEEAPFVLIARLEVVPDDPEDHYEVGLPGVRCGTPCSLSIPTGPALVTVEGADEFKQWVDLVEGHFRMTVHRKHRKRLFVGLPLLVAGGLTMLGGMIGALSSLGQGGTGVAAGAVIALVGFSSLLPGAILTGSSASHGVTVERLDE